MARHNKSHMSMSQNVETWKVILKSGDSFEITDNEFARLVTRARQSGLNLPLFQTDNGLFIVTTQIVAFEPVTWREEVKPKPEEEEVEKEEPSTESKDDIEKRVMEELEAKSNCEHPEDKQILTYSDTKTGRRYFYVCDFCGKRGRNVGKDKLDDTEMEKATPWEK